MFMWQLTVNWRWWLFVWLFLQLRTLRSCPTGFKIHTELNQPHPEKWMSQWNLQKKEKKMEMENRNCHLAISHCPFLYTFLVSIQKNMFFRGCLFYYISNIIVMTVWSNTDFLLRLSNCLTAKAQGNLIPLQSFFHSDHWFSNQTLTFPCSHPSLRV